MKPRFEHAYVINVLSDDHPGIIAAVGRAVRDLGGNIDACSQTVLSGYFTLISIVSVPDDLAAEDLAARIAGRDADGGGLQVMARKLRLPEGQADAGVESFVISAFGPDQPGLVLKFSQYLAGKDINITDLYGDRRGDDFVLISQVEIPARCDLAMLQADLEDIASRAGYTVRLQHENIFLATNQLRLKA